MAGAKPWSAQEPEGINLGPQFVAQHLVSRFEGAEADGRAVAAGVASSQRIANLVPTHIGAIEFVFVAHSAHVVSAK